MLKIVVDIVLGFLATIAGVVFIFLYIKSQEEGHNLFFLIPTFPLIFIGIKLLFRATKLIETIEKVPDPLANLAKRSQDGQSLTAKNNQLLAEWQKTTTDQAKLKMLQMKAESESGSSEA